MAHLLDWFWDLDAQRTGAGHGPNPITWSDMQAWSALTGWRPDPWEAEALTAMDRVRIRHFLDSRQGEAAAPPKLSPTGLRAMMKGVAK